MEREGNAKGGKENLMLGINPTVLKRLQLLSKIAVETF